MDEDKLLCSDGKYRTTAELVAIAKGEDLTPFPNSLPLDAQIKLWMKQAKISNGKTPVKASELYKNFYGWCERNQIDRPATMQAFGRELKSVLPWKRKNSGMYYLVSTKSHTPEHPES